MAEVSYLHLHENDDEPDDSSQDLDAFDWPDQNSILFNRENQVNFVIDMFHQSFEQSQSQSRVTDRSPPDASDLGVIELGFPVEVNHDCWDDVFISRTTIADPDNRSEYFSGGFPVPEFRSESDFPDDPNSNFIRIPNANEDLEWEQIDDHEVLNMISESDPDEQPNTLEWEVLLNAHNLESNQDFGDYNYTDNEMLFGQVLETDSYSSGRPPASVTVVENLASVVITDEDFENKNTVCAVCKDEIGVGLTAKQLPCDHLYHGDCVLQWLVIRNTCPVCRYELLTDDLDYERRKAERGARD